MSKQQTTSAPQARVEEILQVVDIKDNQVRAHLLEKAGPSSLLSEPDFTEAIDGAIEELRANESVVDDGLAARLTLANGVGSLSNNNIGLMKALDADAGIHSITDFARNVGAQRIGDLVSEDQSEKSNNLVQNILRKLFSTRATAVVQRAIVENPQLVPDEALREHVANFLDNQPAFDIAKTSSLEAITSENAFSGIPDEFHEPVKEEVKKLQSMQAIAPTPEVLPVLAQVNLTTALAVSSISEEEFLSRTADTLPEELARETHENAVNATIRNEQTLMTLLETVRGTGMMAIDGPTDIQQRTAILSEAAAASGVKINLETLFGSLDTCDCDKCATVYSPASYFVELLNFLRDNNFGNLPVNSQSSGSIEGTILEQLLRRRPDLGNLELTNENTNTVLPHIDLANEVMESFIVNLNAFQTDTNRPKQATIATFNVETTMSTEELITQPHNVNLDAYKTLASAVYPSKALPYHQPIEVIRTHLRQLKVPFSEVLEAFRPAVHPGQTESQQSIQRTVLDRALVAEKLSLTQEEYIILTKQAFYPKEHYETHENTGPLTESAYEAKVRVRPVHEYYGYETEAEMYSESSQEGLMWVKAQLAPRTQIEYEPLVQLLHTRFINPQWPTGKSKRVLEVIRHSYRYLQDRVIANPATGVDRYKDVIALLVQTLNPSIETETEQTAVDIDYMIKWVHNEFEAVGKLVVLEPEPPMQLEFDGWMIGAITFGSDTIPKELQGNIRLNPDGNITNSSGLLVGRIDKTMHMLVGRSTDEQLVITKYPNISWTITFSSGGNVYGKINVSTGVIEAFRLGSVPREPSTPVPIRWVLSPKPREKAVGIDLLRLVHLDGSKLSNDEWGRFNRFLRLQRSLGWTISDTDMVLQALANLPGSKKGPEITTTTLSQIATIKKLLQMTRLSLDELLTMWQDISTDGDDSTYSRLFLRYNILQHDKSFSAFQPDADSNYFSQESVSIKAHVPELMASLGVSSDDLLGPQFAKLNDKLNINAISVFYRYRLISKILGIKIGDVDRFIKTFQALAGDPFAGPEQFLALLELWQTFSVAGFKFSQLDLILSGYDDPLRPIGPTQTSILQTTLALHNGLKAIHATHSDISSDDASAVETSDLIAAKAQLLYDQNTVRSIIALVEGKTVYSRRVESGLAITVPESLSKKLRYVINDQLRVDMMGILTHSEVVLAKSLSSSASWHTAIDMLLKQTLELFNGALDGIFDEKGTAELLAGDIPEPTKAAPDGRTAQQKRTTFLQGFIPFLRRQAERTFVLDTMGSVAGLSKDLTTVLLQDVITFDSTSNTSSKPTTSTALEKLMDIENGPDESKKEWSGWLLAPSDDSYTFFVQGAETQPSSLLINGQIHPFSNQSPTQFDIWSTGLIKLQPGKLYALTLTGIETSQLQWRTTRSAKVAVPESSLLRDYLHAETTDVFQTLFRAALIINTLKLNEEEIRYFSERRPTQLVAFGSATLGQIEELVTYAKLRNSVSPANGSDFLSLLRWCRNNPAASKDLPGQIETGTGWKASVVSRVLERINFSNKMPSEYTSGKNLIRIQRLLIATAMIGVEVDRIFNWATPQPPSNTWKYAEIADDVRKALRSRFDPKMWQAAVKPLNDQLREKCQNALVSYLLAQKILQDQGVFDADGLFEFLLLDVQMTPLMQTSRIKQAISTIQLYIQRCLLGLELKSGGVSAKSINKARWDWMQKYRLWEANRKVFLYPENYINPTLRDDKTDLFKEMEGVLLQRDLNQETIFDAIKGYVFKLNEIANLDPLAVHSNEANGRIHFFSRTYSAPYSYFWRYYNTQTKNWHPWEQMTLDIPNYPFSAARVSSTEQSTTTDEVTHTHNGTYLVPIEWQNRLLVFVPSLVKSQVPTESDSDISAMGDSPASDFRPQDRWDIKMGWTEHRGGKWQPVQFCSVTVKTSKETTANTIEDFYFLPTPMAATSARPAYIQIFVYCSAQSSDDALGRPAAVSGFEFDGNSVHSSSTPITNNARSNLSWDSYKFHRAMTMSGDGAFANYIPAVKVKYNTSEQSVDLYNAGFPPVIGFPAVESKIPLVRTALGGGQDSFYHRSAPTILSELFATQTPDAVFKILSKTETDALPEVFGRALDGTFHEQNKPYAIYNWELGFHAPMLLVDRLLQAQMFDEALKACHLVFNPLGANITNNPLDAWRFPPFRLNPSVASLSEYFTNKVPGMADGLINEWRDNPFSPHVVARGRTTSYMKWVVLKYIEILVAYGDYYFTQNTLESIPMAIQLYVMASHLYGPRSQRVPSNHRDKKPQTYRSLLSQWDAFGNAMVQLELAFPFSNQPGTGTASQPPISNLFGYVRNLYFTIPGNPAQTALGARIDDRLFKIRHSQDINGVTRQLPLFEPPIDPNLLVQAAAQGVKLSSVLADLNGPMPNYRFVYLLQRAQDACAELKSLGAAFLSAKEKGDAEQLAALRLRHEGALQDMGLQTKQLQLAESESSIAALEYSRKVPEHRLRYFLQQIGADTASTVPKSVEEEFQELSNSIEQPQTDSGLKLSPFEKEEMQKSHEAQDWSLGISIVETVAGVFLALPILQEHATPIGLGLAVHWGAPNIGHAMQAVARGLRIKADDLLYQSSNAGRKANHQRAMQDRVFQANVAGYELKQIDRQILAARIRRDIANHEITMQETQIKQFREVADFYDSKYTGAELYSWLESSNRTLHYQAYVHAYTLAKQAEQAYRFERPLEARKRTADFVQPGYWDGTRDGLLAGEQLSLGLKKLEAVYLEKQGHDFEVTKHVSLRQIAPLALLKLRETGTCEFSVPEILFDVDFPGHYMRRIVSIAVSMPCLVGPYTSVNATLRLLQHSYRIDPSALSTGDDYARTEADGPASDTRFSTSTVPISAVALSSGQSDAGVFELAFKGERFMPFEGAGCISVWALELPSPLRQFDYQSLSDVVLHIRYTAVNGGKTLKDAAESYIKMFIASVPEVGAELGGASILVDVKNEFQTEWYKATTNSSPSNNNNNTAIQSITLSNLSRRLPFYAAGRNVTVRELHFLTDAQPTNLKIVEHNDASNVVRFDSDPVSVGEGLLHYSKAGLDKSMMLGQVDSSWDLVADAGLFTAESRRAWLVVKFTMA